MTALSGYDLGAGFMRLLLAPFTRRRVIGREHIPRTGACILAPNHISHFDPPLIGISTGRHVDWMAMEELFRIPVLASMLRGVGAFPVSRGRMDYIAVRTAVDRLANGHMVGVFPEGGLRTGAHSVLERAPLKPGVSALAQMTQARVVPCAIIGSDALYTASRWLPLRRSRVWVVFGAPIAAPSREGDKEAARMKFDALLGETLRELYNSAVRDEKIPADCLPQTPQRRKGREQAG